MRGVLRRNAFRYLVLLAGAIPALAADPGELPDFANLSLDQLANIRITSFTNKEQQLAKVAGAVYVITKEQIARSGLTSVPELLRLAPGVDVARVNGNQWSVSIRGPVGNYANKLLVLIDGRSVYSPIFSGVYWDVGMPLLENIDRIEVIRGPGATIWGANAVLGVINIITRSARDTHGTMLTAAAGNTQPFQGSIRMGGEFGSTDYRAYFGGLDQAALQQPDGKSAGDGLTNVQGGFRLDGKRGDDTWTLEGDLFRGTENDIGMNVSPLKLSIVASPAVLEPVAGNLTGEWKKPVGERGEFRLRSYYDYVDHPQPQATKAASATWDSEAQYDFAAGRINNLSVGGGGRIISEKVLAIEPFSFSPDALTYTNLNASRRMNCIWRTTPCCLRSGPNWSTITSEDGAPSPAPISCGGPRKGTPYGYPRRGPCERRLSSISTSSARLQSLRPRRQAAGCRFSPDLSFLLISKPSG